MLFLLYYFLAFYYIFGSSCIAYILYNEPNPIHSIENAFYWKDFEIITGVIWRKKKVIEEIELSFLNKKDKKKIKKETIIKIKDDWIKL